VTMSATLADLEARILLEDDGLIAVDKPAGWPSTGRTLEDPRCIQHLLMERLRRRVWAVHQLDADTTGVNLFVRRKALVAHWAERLRRGRKLYVALCHGELEGSRWRRIEEKIGWVESRRGRWVTPEGQRAVSDVRAMDSGEGLSLLEVAIKTGRNHQVRIHLAHAGHPLVGERRYLQPPCGRFGRHALHARRLSFADGQTIEAPLPADFLELLPPRWRQRF